MATAVVAASAGSGWGDGSDGSDGVVVSVGRGDKRGDKRGDSGDMEASGSESDDNVFRSVDASSGPSADASDQGAAMGGYTGPLAAPVTLEERYIRSVGIDGVELRGWHIRALRRSAGLSVAELAKRLAYSRGAVWDWECERHHCPAAVYPALIAVIDLARAERQQLLSRARLHLIVVEEDGGTGGVS